MSRGLIGSLRIGRLSLWCGAGWRTSRGASTVPGGAGSVGPEDERVFVLAAWMCSDLSTPDPREYFDAARSRLRILDGIARQQPMKETT